MLLKAITAPEALADFQSILTKATLAKGHILHQEGAICHHLYLIEKGIARSYYYQDGRDITAHFALEGGSITAIDSFIQNKRSRYTIELLEDTDLFYIHRGELTSFLTKHHQYEKLMRAFLEQIYVELAERIEDMLFHDAKGRYEKLISEAPSLVQRVSMKHIASYLGITQETLSRVRAQW